MSKSNALRLLAVLLANAAFARPDTITEGGFLLGSSVGSVPQFTQIDLDTFDSNRGTLNSATISLTLYGIFVTQLTAAPVFQAGVPVGVTAILEPGFLQVGNYISPGGLDLQATSPLVTLPFGTFTTVYAPAAPDTLRVALPQFALASLESPFQDLPIPISLFTGGIAYLPLTSFTIIESGYLQLNPVSISVTYDYTPLAVSPAPAPEPVPTMLLSLALAGILLYSKPRPLSAYPEHHIESTSQSAHQAQSLP